ncbi:8153_t:CDS:2 [Entrophospora sp. SA101]|nr:8153_t:CDS:2 [Entrophospora sp. SA101]CAJ0839435.1 14966_t:CDS:2 [Entrophospora sp. SA101]CAJ0843854.1 9947_t:CDS:2 [Entrophospora sp. SA101]CAJ0846714.1 5369_t:CDS:2 [Entrophospora sp. SA101]CAJ0846722.1 5372_t:CDS:2 [Entrophospora sp. SA101]
MSEEAISIRSKNLSTAKQSDLDVKDMPETAFIIAFCVKYEKSIQHLFFWPEDFEEALRSKHENPLITWLLRYFLQHAENRPKITDSRNWKNAFSTFIDKRIENEEFFLNYNPLDSVNNDFFALKPKMKVYLLYYLVKYQLIYSTRIKEFLEELKLLSNTDPFDPLAIESLGTDSANGNFLYIGIGSRIYRESITSSGIKWEVISTTVTDIAEYVKNKLDPSRSENERQLHDKLLYQILPYLAPLAKEQTLSRNERYAKIREREIAKGRKNFWAWSNNIIVDVEDDEDDAQITKRKRNSVPTSNTKSSQINNTFAKQSTIPFNRKETIVFSHVTQIKIYPRIREMADKKIVNSNYNEVFRAPLSSTQNIDYLDNHHKVTSEKKQYSERHEQDE